MDSAESTTNALFKTHEVLRICLVGDMGLELRSALRLSASTKPTGNGRRIFPDPGALRDNPRHGYSRLISVIGMYCRSIPFSEGSLSRSPQTDNYSQDNAFGG